MGRTPARIEGFDYIVVGGGTAGCVVASRLSEDPSVRVLVLEAGGENRSLFVRMPAANGFLFGHPAHDWNLESLPQPGLNGRRIRYPRGRGLGGSSAINGMIYIRGNRRDYDAWRDQGLPGWGYADLLPYFRRSEGSGARGDDGFHGTEGPLRTTAAAHCHAADRAFLAAAAEAGLPFNPDFNGREQVGSGIFDVLVHDGRRQSAAATYLSPVRHRRNLVVLTGARATALRFEGRRVIGAAFTQGGSQREATAAREVVLALGSFVTPQLLLLSGIGPPAELMRHGIAVRHALPGVGRNLQDHPNIPLQYACRDPALSLARYQRFDRAIGLALRYLAAGSGPGAAPFWSVGAFRAPAPDARPDLQIFFTPLLVAEDPEHALNRGWRRRLDLDALGRALLVRGKRALPGFQFDINVMHPAARGSVTLASADPAAAPLIDPRYLAEEADRRAVVAGLRAARAIARQPAFEGLRGGELLPGAAVESDEEILAALRDLVTTGHHPVGTCRMGPDGDPEAVLDGRLRVRGLEALRVVDASLFPTQISGNPTGPIVAIAEKAADLILGRSPQYHPSPGRPA